MKYIVDLPKEYISGSSLFGKILSIPIQINGDKNYNIPTSIKITPYTELDRKAIEDAQEEAWEFAKQVSIMKPKDKEECWGTAKYNTVNLGYSYKEAKARHEAWQLEKREEESEIRVGDEVTICGQKRVVTSIDDEDTMAIDSDGNTYGFRSIGFYDEATKTGRHFPEVAELLKKMRDADD